MTASQRIKEIEQILREDPARYWGSAELQRELREQLAALHGGEEAACSGGLGETVRRLFGVLAG